MIVLAGTVVATAVIACLYWAQAVFIPVALAVFLPFVLSPAVTALQRRRATGGRRLTSGEGSGWGPA